MGTQQETLFSQRHDATEDQGNGNEGVEVNQ